MSQPIKTSLVFFGNERLATGTTTDTPVLKALIQAGYPIAAVVSNYKPTNSRKNRPLEIETVAAQHHLPLLLPAKLSDIKHQLQAYGAQAGILVAYGKIIPESIISLFPRGIINIHPSLLPLHRGPVPVESVILNGETKTGVSLMQLAKQMDAGPIFAQSHLTLSGHETKQQLADTLLTLGKDMLLKHLPAILAGTLKPQAQDDTQATYDRLILKSDGQVDWSEPANTIERQIRAYLGWPGSRTTLNNAEAIITAVHLQPEPATTPIPSSLPGTAYKTTTSELAVITGRHNLIIDRLKPAGSRDMTARDFLAGHPLAS